MHLYKALGPDSLLGKCLMRARAELQLYRMRFGTGGGCPPEFVRLVRVLVPQYTMLSARRLWTLYELGHGLAQEQPAGAVVECGVWNGGSSAMVAAPAAGAHSCPKNCSVAANASVVDAQKAPAA